MINFKKYHKKGIYPCIYTDAIYGRQLNSDNIISNKGYPQIIFRCEVLYKTKNDKYLCEPVGMGWMNFNDMIKMLTTKCEKLYKNK